MTPVDRLFDALKAAGCAPKVEGDHYRSACPHCQLDGGAHAPALTFRMNSTKALVRCHKGCTFQQIIGSMEMDPRDMFDEPLIGHKYTPGSVSRPIKPREVACWTYTDEAGAPLFEVARMEPGSGGTGKTFVQRLPGRTGGGIGDTRRVLYRLPDVLAAVRDGWTIYVVEGEKCADAVNACPDRGSAIATTNPGGSGQWKDEYADSLIGASRVIIWRDKDEVGGKWAKKVKESLEKRGIPHVLVESPTHHDAADHLAAVMDLSSVVDIDQPLKLKSLVFSTIYAQPEPVTPWLIKDWLAQGDRVVLAGAAKMGKSCLLLDLSIALSTGSKWLGMFHVEKPQRVIYLDEEQTEILATQRIHRALHGRRMTQEEAQQSSEGVLYLHGNRLSLERPERALALKKAIEDHRADWVLVDTLKRIHSRDENSAEEISAFMEEILAPVLGRAGCILLSHFRKGQVAEEGVLDAVRGSGDFGAWADSIWGYIRDGEQRKLVPAVSRWDGNPRAVHVTKDGNRLTAGSATEADELVAQTILESHTTGIDRVNIVQTVLAEMNCSENTADVASSRSLKKLSSEGTVSKKKIGRRTRYWMRQHAPEDAENDVAR